MPNECIKSYSLALYTPSTFFFLLFKFPCLCMSSSLLKIFLTKYYIRNADLIEIYFYRYLKSVFPKVEETLLLDVLATEDNNVMKAAEKLKALGFEKRDTPPPRLTLRKKEEEEALAVKEIEIEKEKLEMQKPTPPPRMKTLEEKGKSIVKR